MISVLVADSLFRYHKNWSSRFSGKEFMKAAQGSLDNICSKPQWVLSVLITLTSMLSLLSFSLPFGLPDVELEGGSGHGSSELSLPSPGSSPF